jgi:hypothetical protein
MGVAVCASEYTTAKGVIEMRCCHLGTMMLFYAVLFSVMSMLLAGVCADATQSDIALRLEAIASVICALVAVVLTALTSLRPRNETAKTFPAKEHQPSDHVFVSPDENN